MESSKNVFGTIVFVGILLVFIIGGYFSMEYFTKEEAKDKKENVTELTDLRIDKSKDYIYYEDGEEILASEEIHKENAVLNFTTLENINATLKSENEQIYNSIKYTKDMNLASVSDEGNEVKYEENEEGIYSLNYREYEDYKTGEYVSLIVKDFAYDIDNGTTPTALKSYVVEISSGKLISEEELLKKYEITNDIIKEKVKNRLETTQVLEGEESVIDINATLSDLKTYAIYINKNGKLAITFVVKSNQNNYNDSVELN